MLGKNDPNATYVDQETFTRRVREDKIRSELEYEVFYAAGMLEGTFPPDPAAYYAKRLLSALERYLWWRDVLGPRCIQKPPAGSAAEEQPKPAPVVPRPEAEPAPEPAPEAKPKPAPEPAKPKQQRRTVRRQRAEPTVVEPPKPAPPKDPYPQRTGPPSEPKPKKGNSATINGWTYDISEDDY